MYTEIVDLFVSGYKVDAAYKYRSLSASSRADFDKEMWTGNYLEKEDLAELRQLARSLER